MTRAPLAAGVLAVAALNGLAPQAAESLRDQGLGEALGGLFGLDIAVVAACIVGLTLIASGGRGGQRRATVGDWAVAGLAALVLLAPHPAAGWAAALVLGGWGVLAWRGAWRGAPSLRAGAAVFLVLGLYDLLAGRILSNALGPWMTTGDATLAAGILGLLGQDVARQGNVITTGAGHDLVIIGLCTTWRAFWYGFVLCFAFTRWVRPRWQGSEVLTWGLLLVAILTLNQVRLTLFGLDLFYYEALHGDAGGTLFNMAVIVVTLAVAAHGVRHELFRQPVRA